jgi:hypothetical protein
MRPPVVIEGDPVGDPGLGLAAVGLSFEVDVSYFRLRHSRSMKNLSIQRPRPSIEIRMPAAANVPVKTALLNWLPPASAGAGFDRC